MKYSIEVKRSVVKALKKIPRQDQVKIAKRVKKLSYEPRPPDCLRLADSSYYRVRRGIYRIIYDIQDAQLIIVILKVGHRKGVYGRT